MNLGISNEPLSPDVSIIETTGQEGIINHLSPSLGPQNSIHLPTGLGVNRLECLSRFPAAAPVALASSRICIPNKTRPEIDV